MKQRKGQSLLEVLIGIGLGALFIIGGVGLIAPALRTNKQVAQVQANAQLANELFQNTRSWAAGHWDSMLTLATGSANTYYLNATSSPFSVPGMVQGSPTPTGTESVVFGSMNFIRYFYLNDVYRDSNGNVTTTISGNAYDPSTKQITIVVQQVSSTASVATYPFYLTRNGNNLVNQTSWAGGSGQNGAVTFVSSTYASSNSTTITAAGFIKVNNTTASGSLDSATFDTGVVNGAQLNSVIWQGTQITGTSVDFQFAVSTSSGGPWNFWGNDGTPNSYFAVNPGTLTNLLSTTNGYGLFNGYRYFRYRVILFSDGPRMNSPLVQQVVVNWSP
jgi:hypothetical protein